jgi:hypothetical protein
MPNESSTFAVLLARPEAKDPVALAKALAAARKTPLQDQMVIAKSCWGILAENVGEKEATALIQSLKQSGVESIICPTASMAALPNAELAKTFESLATAKPVLIAAAAITTTSMTTKHVKEGPSAGQKIASMGIMLATGLPIKIGGKERTVDKKETHSDLVFYLDVVYQSPARRLRVDALHFDYSFLKERKLYQLMGNFKLLVGNVVKTSPEAVQNHGTKVLLEGKPIQTMGYNSLSDLERETRWLLTLQTLKS